MMSARRRVVAGAAMAGLIASGAMAQIAPIGGGGTTYTAGSGLTLTGTVFSLTSPVTYALGGTGLTALGAANQCLTTNAGATAMAWAACGQTYTFSTGLTNTGGTVTLGDANLTYSSGALSLGASATTAGSLTVYNATGGSSQFFSDSADVGAFRDGVNAQAVRVYDSFTNSTNKSWAAIVAGQTGGSEACAANTLCFGSWHVGTPGGGGSMTKAGLYVDGSLKIDYNVSNTNDVTLNAPLYMASNIIMGSGNIRSGDANTTLAINGGASPGIVGNQVFTGLGFLATAAAPTVAAAQIGYGSTVTANTNCGTLALSTGCIVVNVAGTTRYIPYY